MKNNNKVSYKKIKDKAYDFFWYVTTVGMITGGISILGGYILSNKELVDFGYDCFLSSGASSACALTFTLEHRYGKGVTTISKNRFKAVSRLENKIGG